MSLLLATQPNFHASMRGARVETCRIAHPWHSLAHLDTHSASLSCQPFENSNYSLTAFIFGIESLPAAVRGREDAQLLVALAAGPHETSINHFHRTLQFFVDELKLLTRGVWMRVCTPNGLEERLVRVRSHSRTAQFLIPFKCSCVSPCSLAFCVPCLSSSLVLSLSLSLCRSLALTLTLSPSLPLRAHRRY